MQAFYKARCFQRLILNIILLELAKNCVEGQQGYIYLKFMPDMGKYVRVKLIDRFAPASHRSIVQLAVASVVYHLIWVSRHAQDVPLPCQHVPQLARRRMDRPILRKYRQFRARRHRQENRTDFLHL